MHFSRGGGGGGGAEGAEGRRGRRGRRGGGGGGGGGAEGRTGADMQKCLKRLAKLKKQNDALKFKLPVSEYRGFFVSPKSAVLGGTTVVFNLSWCMHLKYCCQFQKLKNQTVFR